MKFIIDELDHYMFVCLYHSFTKYYNVGLG